MKDFIIYEKHLKFRVNWDITDKLEPKGLIQQNIVKSC